MSKTRRAQILMEPKRYEEFEEIAEGEGVPVSELMSRAVDAHSFGPEACPILSEIFETGIPIPQDPEDLAREIDKAHDAHLS